MRNEKGEVIFLHSVGACRQGEIDGLTLFSASDKTDIATFEPMIGDGDDEAEDGREDLREMLRALISAIAPDVTIADGATDTELAAAAKQAVTALGAAKPDPAKAEEKPDPTKPDTDPVAMSARALSKITALEAKIESRERKILVREATLSGKVVPLSADQIEKIDLTVLESMIAQLPVTVPMESRLGGAIDDFRATPGMITPETREVARQLGLKPEDIA
jgi:phage I-like protein